MRAFSYAIIASAFLLVSAQAAQAQSGEEPPASADCAEAPDENGYIVCPFDQPMFMGADIHVLYANFELPGEGSYADVNLDYFRNRKKAFDVAVYAVKFVPDSSAGHVRLSFTARDMKRNVTKHKYRIVGKLYLQPPAD